MAQAARGTGAAPRADQRLAAVDDARAEFARVVAAGATHRDRRAAYAGVGHAFDEADARLREAVAIAKQRSYRAWGMWRHRLSTLDTARQVHLFAGQDDIGLLPLGSVRAIDTGMSGPDIGDVQHGMSRVPWAPQPMGWTSRRC